MSLSVVSIPIGNIDDITLRAIKVLRSAEVIIGEEFREMTTLLKKLEIPKPQLERLNEHSDKESIQELVEICKKQSVALISDCGTPGFCDPGAELITLCRNAGITIRPIPGASSLMTLLATSGRRHKEFIFRGFLPAKKEAREESLRLVMKTSTPQIIMDTPYRFEKLLTELSTLNPNRTVFVGVDMTSEKEQYFSGTLKEALNRFKGLKAEFVLWLD